MRERKMRHNQKCTSGKYRSGKCGINMQGWKIRDQSINMSICIQRLINKSLQRCFFAIVSMESEEVRPMVVLVPGITSVPLFADRSCHLPTTDETGVQTSAIGRCPTMQALVNHHSQHETDTLPDWPKPAKITQNWSDVVELPGSSNDARAAAF